LIVLKPKGIFRRQISYQLPTDIQQKAYMKLRMLHNAANLNDLRIPPGNRLEKLKGKREGQYSIRINQQWRICFIWKSKHAYDVEIVDYH
jgi:toxin HigB-1